MFLVSLHLTGGCASGATPVPSGPRHWAHVSLASTTPRSGSFCPPETHMTNRTVASDDIAIPPEQGRQAGRPVFSYVPGGKKFFTLRAPCQPQLHTGERRSDPLHCKDLMGPHLVGTRVSDLGLAQGHALKWSHIDDTAITDLTPAWLRGLSRRTQPA